MHPTDAQTATRPDQLPSDEDIARRVLAGEPELFEILMRRHNQRVYRAVRPLLRQPAEVEDVMQQTYVLAFARLRQFQGSARFSTWLVRIAVHEALGRLRRARRHPVLSGDQLPPQDPCLATPPASDPRESAANRELAAVLERAIDALPPGYRQVFILRHVEDMSTLETADALGVSEAVVKTRLVRARTMLHRHLAALASAELGTLFRFHAPRCDRVVGTVMGQVLRAGS